MVGLKNKKTHLLRINIVHSLPGRIRFNCRVLGYLEEVSQDIENELNDMDFIKSASVNIITRRAPLFYDEEQVDQKEIIGLVEHVIGQHSFIAYQKERE